ncbi:MAG: dienelactone hydrolase family protein [Candidatus Dormibacteraeota bacterium]|nr:dienelactone hydrolase family protein [Candidatus Dormibacteraeota bacterium]
MSTSSRSETIRAHDGAGFPGHLALPPSGSGPGMVVVQEIFGLTDYIKGACERLADLGYVALAPDLYWRLSPGVVLDERRPGALEEAYGYMARLDFGQACDDAAAALEHLRGLPEVSGGRAGILGFCLGGGVAYMVAASSDPAVCVSYYGSAIPSALDRAGSVRCPILFQFGGADQFMPPETQREIEAAFAGRSEAEFHVHAGAGHAFDNHDASMFHHAGAARDAWMQTVEFLARTFPA